MHVQSIRVALRARCPNRTATMALLSTLFMVTACRDKGELPSKKDKPAPQDASGHRGDAEGEQHERGNEEHGREVKLTAEAIKRYGITVETASRRNLQPTFTAPARVAFNGEAMAHVGTPLPGRVVDLRAKLGDNVKRGDPLLVIESPELGEAQSELMSKQIAAKTAVAAVELAKSALDRAKRLYDQNRGIALDEVQKREGEHKSAQAALLTAQAAATAAENKLHLLGMDQAAVDKLRESGEVNPRFDIVAPLAGQVVEREVTLGELVSREKESLLVLADMSTLWVLADVPESRLAEVAPGAKAWINAGSLDPTRHQARVSYIAPQVDPRTRTVAVRVAVQCEDGSLKPGMFVQVEVALHNPTQPAPAAVVAVPEEAVQTAEGKTVVFVPVPNEENTFVPRTVSVGKPVGGLVQVLAGLAEGQQFVATGSFILKAELGKGEAKDED